MRSNEVLNVGIVGCGFVAEQWHIPPLVKMKGVKIQALCDRDEHLARQVAARFGIARRYTDLSEMLTAEKLDIVDICTSPQTHAPLCIAAMEAGCHVLVEKPIALSCEQADLITEAAEKNGVKLCVCHNKLFQPMIVRAKRRVDEGQIGDLTGVDLRDSWAGDNAELLNRDHWCHKLPLGAFGEMLPHPVYLLTSLLGRLEPVAVHTDKLTSYEWVRLDELRVILRGERGAGTITASCNWPKGGATIDIFGTKRNLHVDVHSGLLTEYGAGGESRAGRALDNLSQSWQLFACTARVTSNTLLRRHRSGHDVLIARFIDSVRSGSEPPVTGAEGRDVVRVLERMAEMIGAERTGS